MTTDATTKQAASFLDSLPYPAFCLTPEGGYAYMNQACKDMCRETEAGPYLPEKLDEAAGKGAVRIIEGAATSTMNVRCDLTGSGVKRGVHVVLFALQEPKAVAVGGIILPEIPNEHSFVESDTTEDKDEAQELEEAFAKGEFSVQYQPIVSMKQRAVIGFEALVRRNHPEKGLIPPMEFLPLAERTGLIIPLGRMVLTEACKTMSVWRKELPFMQDMSISVNLSAAQWCDDDFPEEIRAVLRATELEPAALKLEVTEELLMRDKERASRMLIRLKELGVKLCLDDFGAGRASLHCLHLFPLDTVKVDQSLVCDMGRDPAKRRIVKGVIALARSLGMEVTAEGIEEENDFDLLADLACESGQGFLFSEPVNGEDIDRFEALEGASLQRF